MSFTNHLTRNYLRAGLLLSDISDHLPVFSINEFALALYEFNNGPVHYDHDRLVDLAFNPLISTIDQHLTCSDDLDPDLHFNTNSRCDYCNEDKFNNILSKDGQSDSNFSILHLNVRSL